MTVTTSSYELNTAEFTEEKVKAILSAAVGFNPRSTKIEFTGESYIKVKLEEKIMKIFSRSNNNNPMTDENIDFVIGQLDSWGGSDMQGNAMAIRAAELIRAMKQEINNSK